MSTPPAQTPSPPPPVHNAPPTQLYDFRHYSPIPKVSYVRTLEHAKSVLAGFLPSGPLGFDLEWRPTYKKGAPENPVALIQLADQHSIMLFQVSCMRQFPSELKQILESPQIVKAGVGIQGDAIKLFRDCRVSMSNCVDLSLLARTVDNARWAGRYNSPIGLARLIECYEYKLLLKGRVSRSDWTAVLSSKQQEYAGNDAHAGFTLYKKLETMTHLMPSLPKAAWYSFHVRNGILCHDDGHLWEPENPDYDPGPLSDPGPPTEAQLRRKRRKAEMRAAQQASSSSRLENVGSEFEPIFPTPTPITYPVDDRIVSPHATLPMSNSMPAGIPFGFTTRQVSGYHHSAGMQTTARNNLQDQRFQSTLREPVSYPSRVNPQNPAQIPQPRPFLGTGKRRAPEPTPRKQHWNNHRGPHSGHRLLYADTRDNIGPSATHVGGNH